MESRLKGKYTILYEKDGITYKLCKIIFGRDGSYFVTSPYHPARQVMLFKATVDYALSESEVAFGQLVDVSLLDDDEGRLKLSHHPDGFVQFSGHGIVSGKDDQGNIKGLGVMSWPLHSPIMGPAFGLAIKGVESFDQDGEVSGETCLFRHKRLSPLSEANLLTLEGYYFPPLWRRFINVSENGTKTISILHPARAVMDLKVLFPPLDCPLQGFIGLEVYSVYTNEVQNEFFCLGGSTGNIRRNKQGHLLGDGVSCIYPAIDIAEHRTLDLTSSRYFTPSVTDDPGGRGDLPRGPVKIGIFERLSILRSRLLRSRRRA